MQNKMYPKHKEFITWCKEINHLSDQSINMINMVIYNFWTYYSSNSIDQPVINNVKAIDVEDYLVQLQTKENLQIRTLNKYLSYLKKYFRFLAEHNFVNAYPLYALNGKRFNRRMTIFINWFSDIPSLLNKKLQPDTIKLLVLISLGFTPKELLSIRWKDISERINNKSLKNYLRENLIFNKTQNPFVFQTKKGEPIKTIEAIMHRVRLDQDKFQIQLSPIKLRQSYVLSCVIDDTKSDAELKKKLKINDKTLSYYKYCASYYVLKDYSLT